MKQLVYCAVLLVLALLLWHYAQPLWRTLQQHPGLLLLLVGIGVLQQAVQASNFYQLLPTPQHVRWLAILRLWSLSSVLNYIAPLQPAIAARTLYLKTCGIGVTEALAIQARQVQLSLLCGVLMSAMALTWMQQWLTASGLFMLFACAPWLFSIFLPFAQKLALRQPHLKPLVLMCKPVAWRSFFLYPLYYLLTAASLWLACQTLGLSVSAPQALLLAVATTWASLVALTPANIGIHELVIGLAVTTQGADTSTAITLAILFRICHIVTILLTTLISSAVLVGWKAPTND